MSAQDQLRFTEQELLLRKLLADYDRRRKSLWGRFLLWLLHKTT